MGLSHSKAHPRVTKVAPLQNKEEETPLAGPVDITFNQNLQEKSSYSLARLQDQKKALEGQLPPLRETRYGRYFAASRAMYFDIPLEQGETSIIKRHPPQRLQKLEPTDLPQVITSERLLSQRGAGTMRKAKELEKKMQTPMYTSGKRQYLHKMQMLEMNRKRQEAQMELKKSLHQEARINKQKLRDHKANKILQSIPRNNDHDLLTMLPDETLNRSPGNSQNVEVLEHHSMHDYCPRKIGKMETWLRAQEAQGQFLWDSSSSDSDELGKDEKKPRALVRTRTERIPVFDDFFDQE
uniref:Coiled-coil domain containing 198 n=1 Tax=Prolemur simus TaxID=1328070 RepID=A0A8C9AUT5_PROSS